MTSGVDLLRQGQGWRFDYDLPIWHQNPHIYMAYADLVLRLRGEKLDPIAVDSYQYKCEIEPGLLNRFPEGGGQTSHDEVMGAASFSTLQAERILWHLDRNDGEYDNRPDRPNAPERYNLYRFPWLRPYLAACALYRVSVYSQAIWSAHVVRAALKGKGVGPHLRVWLMSDKMRRYPLCELAIRFWLSRMKKKGLTLKKALQVEPGIRNLSELAPEEWRWP